MEVEFKCPTDIPGRDIHNFINDPEERVWNGPFTFVQAADSQFGMIGSYKLHKDEPCWEHEIQLAKKAVKNINKMKPKPRFLVICGDMLDAYPFNEPPHYYKDTGLLDKQLRESQYTSFVNVFKELDPRIKLICTCGNHDVGEHPTKDSIQIYYQQYGSDHFSFWVGGIKFVVLNSQLMFSPGSLPQEMEEQNKFIETIKDPSAKFIVVFQHIPYFNDDPNEDDNYTNIGKDVRLPMLDKLDEAGVRYVFCGHTHKNSCRKYKNVEIVVTSALGAPMGTTPSGYRIVDVNETCLKYDYITLQDTTEFKDQKKTDRKGIFSCSKCHIVYTGLASPNYFIMHPKEATFTQLTLLTSFCFNAVIILTVSMFGEVLSYHLLA